MISVYAGKVLNLGVLIWRLVEPEKLVVEPVKEEIGNPPLRQSPDKVKICGASPIPIMPPYTPRD